MGDDDKGLWNRQLSDLTVGDAVTGWLTWKVATGDGETKAAVIAALGQPAGTQVPQAQVSPDYYSDCIVYVRPQQEGSEYYICFESGRVSEKGTL